VSHAAALRDVTGWVVAGRHGTIGRVVQAAGDGAPEGEVLLVQGGTSHVLFFHVPMRLVTRVAPGRRMLSIDADIADFVAHLRDDGSVDLFPSI
jgi:hypothetical protein